MAKLIDVKEYIFGVEEIPSGSKESIIQNSTKNTRHFLYEHTKFIAADHIISISALEDKFTMYQKGIDKHQEINIEIYKIRSADGSVAYTSYDEVLRIYKIMSGAANLDENIDSY